MTTHTIHIRLSAERYATLQTIANGSEYDPSVTAVATSLLNAAIDTKARSAMPEAVHISMMSNGVSLQSAVASTTFSSLATPAAEAALHEGARLSGARVSAGLTHRELGAATGTSRGQVQRAERCANLDGYPKLRAWLAGR